MDISEERRNERLVKWELWEFISLDLPSGGFPVYQ